MTDPGEPREATIRAWRLCLDHDPQPELGQFNWPWALRMAMDEIDRLRAAVAVAGVDR